MNIEVQEDGLLALPDAVLSKILRSVAAPGHPSLCILRLACRGFRTVVDGLVGHLQVVFKQEAHSLHEQPQSQASSTALSEALSALHLQSRYPQDSSADDSEAGTSSQPPPPPPDICLAPLRFRHTHRVTLHLPDGPTPAALHFVRSALPHLAQLVQIDCTGALTRQLVRCLADSCPGLQRLHLSPTSILPSPNKSQHSSSCSSRSSSSSRSSGQSSRISSNSRSSHTSADVGDVSQHTQRQGASALGDSVQHSSRVRDEYPSDSSDELDSVSVSGDVDSASGSDDPYHSEHDNAHRLSSDSTRAVPGTTINTINATLLQACEQVLEPGCKSTGARTLEATNNGCSTSAHSHSSMQASGSGTCTSPHRQSSLQADSSQKMQALQPSRSTHTSTTRSSPIRPRSRPPRRAVRLRRATSTFFLHPSDLRAFAHLRQLRIEPTEPRVLESFGCVEMAALKKLPSLQSLVVLCPLWQMLPQLRDVSLLRSCTGLRHLQLGRIDTSSVGFRLPSLCHLSSLHVLQLGVGGMVDGVAETIGSGLPLLRCLQLTTTRPLGQSGWQALGSLTGLRTLDLAAPAERVIPLLQPPEQLLPGSFPVLSSLKLQLLRWFGKSSQGLEIRTDVLSTLLPIPSLRVLLLAEGFAADDHLASNLAPQLDDAKPMQLEVLMVQGVARLSWRGLCGMLESTGAIHVQLGLSSQLLEDNRFPGLLEDRRILQPGSSLQLKRSSLTLELRISYSSGIGSNISSSNSNAVGSKGSVRSAKQIDSSSHHERNDDCGLLSHSPADSPYEIQGFSSGSKNVNTESGGILSNARGSAGSARDADVMFPPSVPVVSQGKCRQNRMHVGVRGGHQAEGMLLVQACSSGVPVHKCDS